jgi:hypothetical protein
LEASEIILIFSKRLHNQSNAADSHKLLIARSKPSAAADLGRYTSSEIAALSKTGVELVAYLQHEGIVNSRPNIADGQAYT